MIIKNATKARRHKVSQSSLFQIFVILSALYPEQSYKSCSGVLSFAKRVGNTRLINACKRADGFGIYNYGIIDQILRSKADAIPFEDEISNPVMPLHENIRGQDYYE